MILTDIDKSEGMFDGTKHVLLAFSAFFFFFLTRQYWKDRLIENLCLMFVYVCMF